MTSSFKPNGGTSIAAQPVRSSKIHFKSSTQGETSQGNLGELVRGARFSVTRVKELLDGSPELRSRFESIGRFARRVRVSEYHLTNACNIRCKGCWFFEYGHNEETRDLSDLGALDAFVQREKARKVNCAMIIGGEPTLFPARLAVFRKHMPYIIVSSNGYKKLPVEGFEDVAIALTLFGGGKLDDDLRAIRPNGKRFSGLFETSLRHYRNDPRAGYVFAVTEDGIGHIEDTVRRIHDNGNTVSFHYYSKYDIGASAMTTDYRPLRDEALRVRDLFPTTVLSHPYFIDVMMTGRSHWDQFSYQNCPSVSVDHPANADRLRNGNRYLPIFNAWSADMETLKLCCTSGHCESCRDSQAVFSWLMLSSDKFLQSVESLTTWIELAESYWCQFIWSPFNRHFKPGESLAAVESTREKAQPVS